MAEQNPPIFIQAGTHPAEDVRRYMDALAWSRSGIIGSGDLVVSQRGAGANMSVDVAAGRAVIRGTHFSFQGTYGVDARSVTNLVIPAAHGSLDRKDLIVAKVEDRAYTGATSAWSLAVVEGTAAASPAEPTAPANSLTLAMIDVPAADSAIGDAQITDRRSPTAALGGVIVATSSTRPTASVEGRMIYETDTGNLLVSNGTSYGSTTAATFSTVIKTATESVTSSTTLQNDNHLLLSVTASTNYLVEAWIVCDGNDSSSDGPNLKMGWAAPTGATMRWGWGLDDELADDSSTWATSVSSTLTVNSEDFGGSDDVVIFLQGVLVVSTTAGNLQFKWAQASSHTTSTRIHYHSAMRLTPVT